MNTYSRVRLYGARRLLRLRRALRATIGPRVGGIMTVTLGDFREFGFNVVDDVRHGCGLNCKGRRGS